MEDDILGIKGIESGTETAGVGYVVIPKELDAKEYIAHCYKTNTVSMHGGIGYGVFHNISVDKETLQEIIFPQNSQKKGSAVVWINIPKHNKPLIIAIVKYRDERTTLETNSKRITRESNGNVVDMFLRANSATLDLNIIGNESTSGNVNINIKNPSKSSKLKIDVSGDVIIKSSGKSILIAQDLVQLSVLNEEGSIKGLIKYKLGEGFTYKDEFGNIITAQDSLVNIKSTEIKLGEGNEPLVLGDTFKDTLDKISDMIANLADACQKITVTTAMGPSSTPLNAAEFVVVGQGIDNLKESYKNFLSTLSKTD